MDIQFQGFNPVFSTSLLVALLFAVLIFSWWSYAYLKSISLLWKWTLILLRGTSLVILLLLLLNPFVEHEVTDYHKPVIAVYLDNSQSTDIRRNNYNGRETYQSVVESFNFGNTEEVDVRFYLFDGVVQPAENPDELELTGAITNLHEVMRHMHDQSGETVAAVLFSDGIITRGRDPVFRARELDIPLFTVPVGDTTEIRDIVINEVLTNETGYMDTRQPVEITVAQDGFQGENANLQLLEDGEVLESELIDFSEEHSQHRILFELEFEQEGLHNFEAYIPETEGEISIENNRFPFSVNVIDEKTNIVHIASEIHPDVRMLRTLFARDRNVDLQTYTWIGDRYLEVEQIDMNPEEIDLLVIHGSIPDGSGLSEEELVQLPVLQFLTPDMNTGAVTGTVIPITARQSGPVLEIHLDLAEPARTHPVADFDQPDLIRLPTLSIHDADYDLSSTATVLYHAMHEGTETDIPVIVIEETGNIRRGLVNAYGWFAFLQAADSRTREFTEQLFSNLTAWTSTSPDRENLIIEPGKQVYQEGEDIYFRGELTRETGEPETSAVIELGIIREGDQERSYTMSHQSRGNYQLPVGNMSAGDYEYRAEARVAGIIIGSTEGKFTVTPSVLEYLDTKRDDDLLREMTAATGGRFLEEQDPAVLISELQDRNLLDQIEESQSIFRFLHQYVIWFLIVVTLLGLEWLLRRRLSLP